MTFRKELEMYPIIKEWLENRERDPCSEVVIDKYRFDTGQKFRADLIGVYLRENDHRFVGVEAKLDAPFSLKPLGQAQAMQTFCHEVYLAIPSHVFTELDDRKKESLQSMLSNQKMGLLLVQLESPRVKEEVKAYALTFRLDLYKEAADIFSYILEKQGQEILSRFKTVVGQRFGGWWTCFVEDSVTTLFHSDFKSEDKDLIVNEYYGKIEFAIEKIDLSIDIFTSDLLKTIYCGEEDTSEVHNIIKNHLKRLDDCELDFIYGDEPFFSIYDSIVGLALFEDELSVYNFATLLASREVGAISINLTIERPTLINVKDESQMNNFIRNLVDAYGWLHALAVDLGAKCDQPK